MPSFSPGPSILGPPPIFPTLSNASQTPFFSNSIGHTDFVHCLIPRESIPSISQGFLKNQILEDGIRLASVIVNLSSSFLRSTQFSYHSYSPPPPPTYVYPPSNFPHRRQKSSLKSKTNRQQKTQPRSHIRSKSKNKSMWIWRPKNKEAAPTSSFNPNALPSQEPENSGLIEKLVQSDSPVEPQVSPGFSLNAYAAPFMPSPTSQLIGSDQSLLQKVNLHKINIMKSLDDSTIVDFDVNSSRSIVRPKENTRLSFGSKSLDDIDESSVQGLKSIREAKRKIIAIARDLGIVGQKRTFKLPSRSSSRIPMKTKLDTRFVWG